jgi:predicted alpha-1,2-mannosidase
MNTILSRRQILQAAAALSLGAVFPKLATASKQKAGNLSNNKQSDLIGLVNVLQGTDSTFGFSRGNTLPIFARPFGLTHWTLQSKVGDGWFFNPSAHKIQGIRGTHQPSPWMGDYAYFTVMGQSGTPVLGDADRALTYDDNALKITPASLDVTFTNSALQIEATATERCSFFRFTFPVNAPCRVIIDSHPEITADIAARKVTGRTRLNKGEVPANFGLHFVALFDQPIVSVAPDGDAPTKSVEFAPGSVVLMRLGTSFISAEQAELNIKSEIGERGYDAVKRESEAVWNQSLGRLAATGGSDDQRRTFYSCLYRAHLFPRILHEYDQTGKMVHYSPYDGNVHDGPLYCDTGFWDSFRAVFSLFSLLYPERYGEFVQGLVNAYKEGGWVPQWPSPGYRGCMTGTHSDVVMADAVVKGITGFDMQGAYDGMIKHATDPGTSSVTDRRTGLAEYLSLGYVPADKDGAATAKTLDYSLDDFSIYQVAKVLGKTDDIATYAKRALNYRNAYNAEVGFMDARLADGSWKTPFDQYAWGGAYVEGGPWQSSWTVPHDPAGLIEINGGAEALVKKLDRMLLQPPVFHVGSYGSTIHEMAEMAAVEFGQYDQGNQPVHLTLNLFTAAGCPAKTQYWVRRVVDKLYTPDGFPGDEDNGEMSAWYVLNAIGLFPLCPGTDEYVIGSPIFPEMVMTPDGHKATRILAPRTSQTNVYVQNVKIAGKPYQRTVVGYRQLMSGTTLEIDMASRPPAQAVPIADLPYSLTPYTASSDMSVFDTAVCINCGGDENGEYVGDVFFRGGDAAKSDATVKSAADDLAPEAVYQSQRTGTFSYEIPLPMPPEPKTYTVCLHFAQTQVGSPGASKADVSINGHSVLVALDVFAEAGANAALVKKFAGILPGPDGTIKIAVKASSKIGDPASTASLCGIEIRCD